MGAGLTWGGHAVLVGGFVVAQGQEKGLDGPDEDPCQASVEYHVEQEDLDCGTEEHEHSLQNVSTVSSRLSF